MKVSTDRIRDSVVCRTRDVTFQRVHASTCHLDGRLWLGKPLGSGERVTIRALKLHDASTFQEGHQRPQ